MSRLKFVELNSEIADAIAVSCTHTSSSIYSLWEILNSWDLVMATVGYAEIHGIADLRSAVHKMTETQHQLDSLELYRKYGRPQ